MLLQPLHKETKKKKLFLTVVEAEKPTAAQTEWFLSTTAVRLKLTLPPPTACCTELFAVPVPVLALVLVLVVV